jgi:hypothetical protein
VTRSRVCLAVCALAVVAVACTPPIRQFDLRDQQLSCEDANRLTYRTLEAMRFKISDFRPATAGQPGLIKATRTVSGSDGGTQGATVAIDCRPSGADIDARQDGAWFNQMDFKRAFHHAFVNVVDMSQARARLDQQEIAGTAPASQQRRDLQIVVEPLTGQAAKLDFPFDLAASGVLPVRVSLTNLTAHAYTIDAGNVRLARADGERVTALSVDEAASRITATAVPGGAPPSREAARIALAAKQFTATALAPSAAYSGFLYFPAAEYRGARVVVTDTETGEDEGVRVEF